MLTAKEQISLRKAHEEQINYLLKYHQEKPKRFTDELHQQWCNGAANPKSLFFSCYTIDGGIPSHCLTTAKNSYHYEVGHNPLNNDPVFKLTLKDPLIPLRIEHLDDAPLYRIEASLRQFSHYQIMHANLPS